MDLPRGRRRRSRIAALLVSALLVAACSGDDDGDPPAATSSGGDTSAAVEATDADRQLVTRWWEWAAAAPEETNPISDPDGRHCAANQPGDVWFLAATFGGEATRSCTVPAGRQLFAPVINQVCSPDIRCEINEPSFTATLDGEPLRVIAVDNDPFTVAGVADNPVTFEAAPVELVATGFWVRFGPLGAGQHTVVLEGSEPSGFSTKVTYQLTVA